MPAPVHVALAGGLLLVVGTVSAYCTGVAADEAGQVGAFTPVELFTLSGGLVLLVTALALTAARSARPGVSATQARDWARPSVVLGALSVAAAWWTLPGFALGAAVVATAAPQLRRSPRLARLGLVLGVLGLVASVVVPVLLSASGPA